MANDSLFLAVFSMNLIYVVVNIYAFLLKMFYVPTAYKEIFGELYPARNSLANLFIMQALELPYIFFVYRPEVLFCLNAIAMLFTTSYLVILTKGYFFLEFYTPKRLLFLQHPIFICWIALLLPVFGIIEFTPMYKTIMTIVVLALEIGYIAHLDRCRVMVIKEIRAIEEDEFSNETDFPILFARRVKWLPLLLCVLLIVTFLCNMPVVKMIRDIIMSVISIWFAIYSLNPHRNAKKLPKALKNKEEAEEVPAPARYRLTEKYCKETQEKLIDIVRSKKLYLEEHITMNDLIDIMHTNKNYLSEVIARSEYQSFYKLINTMRIEHACEMLQNDTSLKLEQVALESGFTSGSSFSQIFKRIMNITPKEYISTIHAE
ncbi:MAG: AraC family transcriptional regulator [Bacteroidales bacterium]|nr:AraC family transcriptional regulator [Bacteroidales bacterium]